MNYQDVLQEIIDLVQTSKKISESKFQVLGDPDKLTVRLGGLGILTYLRIKALNPKAQPMALDANKAGDRACIQLVNEVKELQVIFEISNNTLSFSHTLSEEARRTLVEYVKEHYKPRLIINKHSQNSLAETKATERKKYDLNDSKYDQMTVDELLSGLQAKSSFTRGRALAALARRAPDQNELLTVIGQAILEPQNLDTRLIGSETISYLCIANLINNGDEQCDIWAKRLLDMWPDASDKRYLLDWLRFQKIQLPEGWE